MHFDPEPPDIFKMNFRVYLSLIDFPLFAATSPFTKGGLRGICSKKIPLRKGGNRGLCFYIPQINGISGRVCLS